MSPAGAQGDEAEAPDEGLYSGDGLGRGGVFAGVRVIVKKLSLGRAIFPA